MGLQHPELLLLALPAAYVWWRARSAHPIGRALRALFLALTVLALASPYLPRAAKGRDLVVVVDRSRSMPEGADAAVLELVRLAEEERASGDRLAVVAFGARAAIERGLSEDARFAGFAREIDADGSDLAGAIETALELVPDERPGSILLVTDGELRGRDPLPAVRRTAARGLRVDVRELARAKGFDLAVQRLDLPGAVALGEPFQIGAWVRTDQAVEADYVLERDGEVLARGSRLFEPGANRLVFRDLPPRAGVAEYRLRVLGANDRAPENDVGLGALLVEGAAAILVVNHDGGTSPLASALRAAGLSVEVARPEDAPLDLAALEARRAVVLENVAAGRIASGLRDLRRFVLERGGGLLLTGGRAGFGVGGYFLSAIDDVLPVSMEIRDEQRQQGIALAIALDRSGSMAAAVDDGRTKMELADRGAAEAIGLLSRVDAVAVIAVDSAAHLVQELTAAEDPGAISRKVLRIESQGGGIFVRTALLAAADELAEAEQQNRHVILFADAADSEEQEGCEALVGELAASGVTLSVIALGTEADQDAEFLKRIAALGGGEAYFTQSAHDLPRLFAQDTLTATRTAFVEEPTAVDLRPELFGIGEPPAGPFPTLGGYNLTWLREGATAGALARSELQAPIFAFSRRGIGRTAAFTGEAGGRFGAELVRWPGFGPFFATVARWLVGPEPPAALYASISRAGREALVSVEVDASAGEVPDLSQLSASMTQAGGEIEERPLERVGIDRYEARFELRRPGIALASVRAGDELALRLPPLALPYSPELEPSDDPEAGARLVRRIARESGGAVEPSAAELFRGPRTGRAWRPIGRELALVALLLFLVEIAGRRLALFESLASRLRRVWRRERVATRHDEPSAPRSAAREGRAPTEAQPMPRAPARPATPPGASASLADALERARRAAERELGR